ncbi:acyl-CoA N-acyltransferase [Aspergillus keveii]|uniref:Acyl-CoA N-acyltransferase n=1 Tax=Aspergillus keveii TaxID=714993 RepID=A0ABR4FPR8_9EURO
MTIIAPRSRNREIPPATPPSRPVLEGRTVTLTPLLPSHAPQLFPLLNNDTPEQKALWTYIPDGPYDTLEHLTSDLSAKSASRDPLFFAILDNRSNERRPVGYIALMAISVEHRRLEIGHVMFSKALQKTTGATETVFLLMKYAFDTLGFRRVEWKCNNQNEGSRRAALRLGFQYEGLFRQHMVVKGKNRDTAWFSVVDGEWRESVKEVLETWLDEGNFSADGRQIRGVEEVREKVRLRIKDDLKELELLRREMAA